MSCEMAQVHWLKKVWHASFASRQLPGPPAADSVPYYGQGRGKFGLNGGIIMLSLARIRDRNFSPDRDAYVAKYHPTGQLKLGPQDILNVYGNHHPDRIYEMPCIYNARLDADCDYESG